MRSKLNTPWLLAILTAAARFEACAAAESVPDGRPTAEALARPCFACHGGPESSVIPDIRGIPETIFVASMRGFRDQRRHSVMHRIAQGYRDGDFAALARHFLTLRRGEP